MCQAMFEAQVMSELQILEIEKDTYIGCVYCGEPKGDWLSCCGENHFAEMQEWCIIPILERRLNVYSRRNSSTDGQVR